MNVRARICDGRHAAREQVGDAVRDDAGLAAARPGQHQQRPVAVQHGLALRFGEMFEEWIHTPNHSAPLSIRTSPPGAMAPERVC